MLNYAPDLQYVKASFLRRKLKAISSQNFVSLDSKISHWNQAEGLIQLGITAGLVRFYQNFLMNVHKAAYSLHFQLTFDIQ